MQELTEAQIKNQNLKERVAEESSKSLYVFLRNFWHILNEDEFQDNWHIKAVCDELQIYGEQVIAKRDALPDMHINIPPGTSKSTMVSQMFQMWLWIHAPWLVMISTSYTQTLANEHSIKTKKIYESDLYQECFNAGYFRNRFGKTMSLSKDTERDWENNYGGRRFATAKTVTGVHAHIIIRDDPMGVEDAESEVQREAKHRFNDQTLPSRMKDKEKCPTITVAQRLHQDDTTGHDIENPDLEIYHVCLPAELSKNVTEKYRKFYVKGLLDPVRLSKKVLKKQHDKLKTYGYSGQYMQTPFPEEGGKVKRDWFVILEEADVPKDVDWDMWIDGAYTKETENDPSGIMICGFSRHTNKLYIKHAESYYLEMPDMLERVPLLTKEHKMSIEHSKTHIEPKASGISLQQMLLQDTLYDVYKIGGKLVNQGHEARLQTASPKIKAGRVNLCRGNWNEAFIDQICFFPNMTHDEYVDLIGYAVYEYYIRNEYEIEVEVH